MRSTEFHPDRSFSLHLQGVVRFKVLETVWSQTVPQLIVLWGKRRVGKTELIKQLPGS